MPAEILSQDEIDALLTGVDEGNVDTGATDAVPGDQSHTYDFTSQDRIVRGRLPTLEMINERFARNFRVSLFNFLRRSPTITVEAIQMSKFSEYISGLFTPCNLNLIKIRPLRGTALFVLNPTLVYSIVDRFFGGNGRFQMKVEERDFTHTEVQVIRAILDRIFEDLRKAWEPIMALEFEQAGTEVNSHFANIVSPSEVVVVNSFTIELENAGGELHMTFPDSKIEPIREQLHAGVQSDTAEHDQRWERLLREGVNDVPLLLKSTLARTNLSLGEIRHLRPGDIIPIDLPQTITADVEGIPVLRGTYGVSRGNHAMKVTEIIRAAAAPDKIQ